MSGTTPHLLVLGERRVDLRRRIVQVGDTTLTLTALEVDFLRYLVERANQVVPVDELLVAVWGNHPQVRSRSHNSLVARLRPKLEPEPNQPRFLLTARGRGYRLNLSSDAVESALLLAESLIGQLLTDSFGEALNELDQLLPVLEAALPEASTERAARVQLVRAELAIQRCSEDFDGAELWRLASAVEDRALALRCANHAIDLLWREGSVKAAVEAMDQEQARLWTPSTDRERYAQTEFQTQRFIALTDVGRHAELEADYPAVVAQAQQCGAFRLEGVLHTRCGTIAAQRGDIEEAQRRFVAAGNAYLKESSVRDLCELFVTAAVVLHFNTASFRVARIIMEQVVDTLMILGDERRATFVRINLATTLLFIGETDEAHRHAQAAMSWHELQQHRVWYFHGHLVLGRIEIERGNYARALGWLEQADFQAERLERARLIGHAQRYLGWLRHLDGDRAAALRHYRVAIEQHKASGDRLSEAVTCLWASRLEADPEPWVRRACERLKVDSLAAALAAVEARKDFDARLIRGVFSQ